MKKKNLNVKVIAEIAIFAALAFALDALQGGIWRGVFINGGSIGLAMVPLLILCYRRGFGAGLLCGIILAFLQMLPGIYAISDAWYKVLAQILLDYVLAYPVVAIAGFFYHPYQKANNKKEKITYIVIGSVLGGIAKFLCHFLSGVLFWPNPDFKLGSFMYSLLYNGAYMLPNIIISIVVLVLIVWKQEKILIVAQDNQKGDVTYENK
jgi:thiamine transporter